MFQTFLPGLYQGRRPTWVTALAELACGAAACREGLGKCHRGASPGWDPRSRTPSRRPSRTPAALPCHLEALVGLTRRAGSRYPWGRQTLCHTSMHLLRGMQRSEAGSVCHTHGTGSSERRATPATPSSRLHITGVAEAPAG